MRKRILASVFAASVAIALAGPAVAAPNDNGNGNNGNGNSSSSNNGNGNSGNNGKSGGATPSPEAETRTVFLKGSGSNFSPNGWQNVFTVGEIDEGSDPSVWHLVYSGKEFNQITSMQVTFTNGEVFQWTPGMKPSVNGGGNNMGWVIVAPYDWVIAYVDKGNNNDSESFVVTAEPGNGINFNISGYHKGRPADKPQLPKGELTLDKTVDGGAFADWKLPAGYDGTLADLLADITFELYEADGTELKATGTLNAEGKITFDRAPGELAPGWYDVVEKLGPSAAEVFAPADKPVRIYFNGYSASVDGDTFDPSAEYYVSWDWVQNNAVVGHNGVPVKTTFANGVVWDGKKTEIWKDYLGTGQDNEIQGITARTSRGGDDYQEYVSFCAHVGSWSYAENNSYAAFELTDEARGKILSAFNYILTTGEYGEFSKNAPPNAARILAQLAVWYFLPPDSSEFEIVDFEFSGTWEWLNSEWPAVKEAGNSFRYAKTGPVKGLFYLTSGDEAGQRQPQIIPLFGDGVINNTTKGELNVDVNLVTEVQKQLQKTNTSVGTSTYGSSWTAVSDTPVLACPGENNSNQNLHYETILVENLPDGAVLGPYAIGSRDNANRAVGGSFWITRVGNEIFVVMDKDDVVTATGVVARVFTGEDVPCWGNAASNGGGVTLAGGGSTVATAGWDKGSRFQLTADVTTIHVAVKGATVAYVDPSKTTYACELVREDPIETKPYVGAAEVTFVVDGQRYGRDESASLAPGKYTVELWLDGEMVASLDDVVVSAGATTTASFGDVVVGQLEQDVWEENPVAGSPGCFTWL